MAERGKRTKVRRAFLVLFPVLLVGSCSSVTPTGCAAPPEALASAMNSAFAPVLARLISHSRDSALDEGTRPIPEHIREILEPHFGSQLLYQTRWTTASDRWAIDTLVREASPRHKAITLDDVIVFLDPAATSELDVWVHELLHVRQVKGEGGIAGFSRKYVADWHRIEADTIQMTKNVLQKLGRQPSRSNRSTNPADACPATK